MITPRLPLVYLAVALSLSTLVVYLEFSVVPTALHSFHARHTDSANSTLGFGGLYVVSGPGSPRRIGLVQSANVTELDFSIPDLPAWSDAQVNDFRSIDELGMSNGSVKAWLSHHVVLREFLKSGQETALILEDDVDWDIRLRTEQIPKTAAAFRSLLPPADKRNYWGHPDDWGLLYLGHCGDYWTGLDMPPGVGVVHPEDLQAVPHTLFYDPTMPDRTNVHPYTASLLTAFNVPEKTRMIHKSKWPLCTFGYAVTRSTAQRIIEEFAPAKQDAEHQTIAYDIAILEACRDRDLRCFTISPELFHHMEGASMIDVGTDRNLRRPPIDRLGFEQVLYRNETSNIGCGFWSGDFRWNGDFARLEYLREEVGRKGQCLKPGRNHDGSFADRRT